MKIGDLVRIKARGLSLQAGEQYLGHVGIITEIVRSEANDDGSFESVVEAMINNKVATFLPRYVEVIYESR